MMDEQRMLAQSRLYIEERIAAAEKERLLRMVGTRRTSFPAWVGSVLVRVGRRLESCGGAAQSAPSLNMRRAA